MKNYYKRLGNYIHEVKIRNSDLKAKKLLGININKYFMPSVANIVGTDLTNYKMVKKNQFACNRMHVGRDYRIPIAISNQDEIFIVSPAYDVFEINDTNNLNPEYLMMWFSRTEFDRNAWFYTDADVRGGLAWKSFCNMQLPIPPIETQKQIVAEYHTIQNRINLNNQIIKELEQTAQAIYKKMFIDDIDPENLPPGWKIGTIGELVKTQYGYTEIATTKKIGPKFLRITDIAQREIIWNTVPFCKISEKEYEKYKLKCGDIVIARTGATVGYAKRIHKYVPSSVFASFLVRLTPKVTEFSMYLGLIIENSNYKDFILANAEGSAQPQANATLLTSFGLVIPDNSSILKLNRKIESFFDLMENIQLENQKLLELQELLLSKLSTIGD